MASAYREKIRKQKTGYFRVSDIEATGEITVTIDSLAQDQLIFDKTKDVLIFQDHGQQLVVNTGNAETLMEMLGDEPDRWTGQKVTLYIGHYKEKGGAQKPTIKIKAPSAEEKVVKMPARPAPAPVPDRDTDDPPF